MEKPTGEMLKVVKSAVVEFLNSNGFVQQGEKLWFKDGIYVEIDEGEVYTWLKYAVIVKKGAATCTVVFTEHRPNIVPQYSIRPKCFAFKSEDKDVEKNMDVVFELGSKIYIQMEKALYRELISRIRDRDTRLFMQGLQILYEILVNSRFKPIDDNRSLWIRDDGVQAKVVIFEKSRSFKATISRGVATCYVEFDPRDNFVAPSCTVWEYTNSSNEDEDIELVFGLAAKVFERLSKLIAIDDLKKK